MILQRLLLLFVRIFPCWLRDYILGLCLRSLFFCFEAGRGFVGRTSVFFRPIAQAADHEDRRQRQGQTPGGEVGWSSTLGELAGYPLAVEFRHHSWYRPEVADWLGDRKLDLVAVDVPDLPGLYPRRLVQSGPLVYVRFHSRNAENWYRSDKDRYDYHYDDAAMIEWIEALTLTADRTQRVLLLFNNCQRSQAVENARRMRELWSITSRAWNV